MFLECPVYIKGFLAKWLNFGYLFKKYFCKMTKFINFKSGFVKIYIYIYMKINKHDKHNL